MTTTITTPDASLRTLTMERPGVRGTGTPSALEASGELAARVPGTPSELDALLDALPEASADEAPSGTLAPPSLGLGALIDPGVLLMALQSELRASGATSAELEVEGGEQRSEVAHAQRREALEKAEKAGRRARRLLHRAPPWIKKLVAGVISAVGAAASVYTGGASMGLAIAGATLLLASDGIVKALEAAGVDPKKTAWVGVALKVTGAVLSAASGVGASEVVPDALESAETVAAVVDATTQAVDGAQGIAHAAVSGRERSHLLDAETAALRADEAEQALEEATAELGAILDLFARAAARAAQISAASGEARLASVSQLA